MPSMRHCGAWLVLIWLIGVGCDSGGESPPADDGGAAARPAGAAGMSSGGGAGRPGGGAGSAGESVGGGGNGASGGSAGDGNGGDAGQAGRAGDGLDNPGAGGLGAEAGAGGSAGAGAVGGTALPTFASIDELLTRCPTAAELAAIDADFHLVFDNVDTSGPLVCTGAQGSRDLTRPRERAYQAFLTIRAIKFDAPLPWTTSTLYQWLRATIQGINYTDASSSCCGTGPRGGVYLFIRLGPSSIFYGTELWVNDSGFGMAPLVDLMVHEARHANIGHHTCPDGVRDRNAQDMGAWGTEFSFQRWLAYHADPCFWRPTLPTNTRYPNQLLAANAYQLAALEVADRTAEVRFCDSPPPYSNVVTEPLPLCRP